VYCEPKSRMRIFSEWMSTRSLWLGRGHSAR
jgi:hypothetical protein